MPADSVPCDSVPCESQAAITARPVVRWQQGQCRHCEDDIASEQAVAMVYNGITHAVMMATPQNLADFGLGFSLSEGIIEDASELYSHSIDSAQAGLEINMQISNRRFDALKQHRRMLAGVSGCGLCGAESLQSAVRPMRPLAFGSLEPIALSALQRALADFERAQRLRAQTGAMHAAAWCDTSGQLLSVREDIGRHNAMDKVIGAMAQQGWQASAGFLLLSSRISFELVQKAASTGISMLVAASAPSTLAMERAEAAGICLIGRVSEKRATAYTQVGRMRFDD